MTLKIGKCKLCLQDKELLKRSHIVPEFIYKHSGMYDDKHRYNQVTTDKLFEGHYSGNEPKKKFKGVYEGDILCQHCDGVIIHDYEDYGKKIIYDAAKCDNYQDPVNGLKFTLCKGVDYKQFKLFMLSMLWRASISSRDNFDFMLPSEQEEELREMILNGNPKNSDDFPFVMMTFNQLVGTESDFILFVPMEGKNGSYLVKRLAIDGLFIDFFHGKNYPADILQATLTSKGDLYVYHIPETEVKSFLEKSLRK